MLARLFGRQRLAISAVVFSLVTVVATSQVSAQDGPIIIPAELQRLAPKVGLAERLNVTWSKATSEDVGRYNGMLAAIFVAAQTIAKRNARAEPTENDYWAAFSVMCLWPPNKPALVEPYWPKMMAASYSAKARAEVAEAIGPNAVEIADIQDFSPAILKRLLPDEPNQYFKLVFDVTKLKGAP